MCIKILQLLLQLGETIFKFLIFQFNSYFDNWYNKKKFCSIFVYVFFFNEVPVLTFIKFHSQISKMTEHWNAVKNKGYQKNIISPFINYYDYTTLTIWAFFTQLYLINFMWGQVAANLLIFFFVAITIIHIYLCLSA